MPEDYKSIYKEKDVNNNQNNQENKTKITRQNVNLEVVDHGLLVHRAISLLFSNKFSRRKTILEVTKALVKWLWFENEKSDRTR